MPFAGKLYWAVSPRSEPPALANVALCGKKGFAGVSTLS